MNQPLKNRKSPRAAWWDYHNPGAYFVTICTKNREHFFGEIKNGKMQYSNAGIIAFILWQEIKNHFPTVELDEFVVMPNHFHGIIILSPISDSADPPSSVRTGHAPSNDENIPAIAGTGHALSLQSPPNPPSLSTIIGSYKSAVTKYCNRLELPFEWQTRFHDIIIKNQQSFDNIQNYIIKNPINWENDDFYKH